MKQEKNTHVRLIGVPVMGLDLLAEMKARQEKMAVKKSTSTLDAADADEVKSNVQPAKEAAESRPEPAPRSKPHCITPRPPSPQGSKPPVEPDGPTGSLGPTSPISSSGSTSVASPTCPTGSTSPTSPTGPTGSSDPSSPSSPTGPTGSSDPSSPTSPTGPTGPTGSSDPSSPIGSRPSSAYISGDSAEAPAKAPLPPPRLKRAPSGQDVESLSSSPAGQDEGGAITEPLSSRVCGQQTVVVSEEIVPFCCCD
ncbi:vegetative cell wall protein gp1-like [Takifugu rubripes]|uniref:vegetative cell wall protein gp1-like n=1 Tax=Takifugu rubripes TaxID=31033 RepID=UPI001145211E|nr:vegetative cell wall protein gp1-like [Takifugu rubripes]